MKRTIEEVTNDARSALFSPGFANTALTELGERAQKMERAIRFAIVRLGEGDTKAALRELRRAL